MKDTGKLRPIAIHLPQFHLIPENDTWWGKGFTEWTNVKKAKALFFGHKQPHIPLCKNYYDLSQFDDLCWQKELAISYGIHGFCFYHYWFNGKLLLQKPLELILKDKKWDFPYCLCWANENWTRTWDGLEQNVLMRQEYSPIDDSRHFIYFERFFASDNYIKVDNKPVLLIYRSELFPNVRKTCDLWREMAISSGYEGLYLIRVESFLKGVDPELHGFDAALDFQPDWSQLPTKLKEPYWSRFLRRLQGRRHSQYIKNRVYDYKEYFRDQIIRKSKDPGYKRYPCVMPSWDNSARRQKGAVIFKNSKPSYYKAWLKSTLDHFEPFSSHENFVFINAWNEWAEGNHLEPCERWSHKYLEATNENLKKYNK